MILALLTKLEGPKIFPILLMPNAESMHWIQPLRIRDNLLIICTDYMPLYSACL